MRSALKLTLAAIVAVVATAIVSVVAYEHGRTEPEVTSVRYAVELDPLEAVAVRAKAPEPRVELSRKAVLDLGRTRDGCTLTDSDPPVAACDVEAAFPDVGFDGRVTLVGAGRDEALTFSFGG